jgi:hypothetical protein
MNTVRARARLGGAWREFTAEKLRGGCARCVDTGRVFPPHLWKWKEAGVHGDELYQPGEALYSVLHSARVRFVSWEDDAHARVATLALGTLPERVPHALLRRPTGEDP